MGTAGCLPLREGMLVMSRPNIQGTRYLTGPGPREPHGLHSACPTPQLFRSPTTPTPFQPGQAARRLASPLLAPVHLGTCPNKSKHSRRLVGVGVGVGGGQSLSWA